MISASSILGFIGAVFLFLAVAAGAKNKIDTAFGYIIATVCCCVLGVLFS